MKYGKKQTKIMEGDLTPMIDMTFQLIAFFMLLINFSEVERAEEITLPVSVLAIPPDSPPDYQIILNLNPNGSIRFQGQTISQIDRLTPIFTQEINQAAREGVNNPNDISVIIRSHELTPTGVVQKLISKCQSQKLENFALRVKDRK
jgi:biopolymer transport protein ExbD